MPHLRKTGERDDLLGRGILTAGGNPPEMMGTAPYVQIRKTAAEGFLLQQFGDIGGNFEGQLSQGR